MGKPVRLVNRDYIKTVYKALEMPIRSPFRHLIEP